LEQGVSVLFNVRELCILAIQKNIKRKGINMDSQCKNLTRRKFMMASSAAIATPLLLNAAGSMAAAKTAETRTAATSEAKTTAAKGSRVYFIGRGCIGCQACRTFCPGKAIHFGDTGNEIDQKKCLHCGTCYRECPISVVTETEIS
jgi:Pyruvate/2-oxoacid:ferredoxin oxidoreductase delta subunit